MSAQIIDGKALAAATKAEAAAEAAALKVQAKTPPARCMCAAR